VSVYASDSEMLAHLVVELAEIKDVLGDLVPSRRSLDNPGESLAAYIARTNHAQARDCREPGGDARKFLRPRLELVS
jgi:hypothetical protein